MSNDVNADLPRLIREVKRAGYKISNLFHRADGMCQANLRSTQTSALVFAWGYGPCFADALSAALQKARAGKVAPMSVVGDDERNPRALGELKEHTRPIHPDELLPGQEGLVPTVDPRAPDPRFDPCSPTCESPDEDDEDLLGGAPAEEYAAMSGAADDDDDDVLI